MAEESALIDTSQWPKDAFGTPITPRGFVPTNAAPKFDPADLHGHPLFAQPVQGGLVGDTNGTAPATTPLPVTPLVSRSTLLDPAAARAQVLARIAGGEAKSYNEIYGGGSFSDYADHPRQRRVITEGPHKGEYSDAAGLYQFLSSTWDAERAKLGLKDFSPPSQDAAAWDLAATMYKSATRRDLQADAMAGKVDYAKLAGQWPSLSSGGSQVARAGGSTAGANGATYNFNYGGAGGGASDPTALIQAEMKLQLLRNLFPQHAITPVEYDPFKVQPSAPAKRVDVNEGVI